ncbi:hypothetical protein ACHWQZ_G010130 [Mnemiopsis leidyi]
MGVKTQKMTENTPTPKIDRPKVSTYRVKHWFLCCLALCHLAAFSSLYLQWPGLYGEEGVMPAHQATPHGFSVKTLAETFNLPLKETAELVCLIGTVLAGLLTAFPALRVSPAYALLGALYFSLYQVGRKFLWFQWDIILIETTCLSVFVAPLFPTKHSLAHDNITLWLVRWLAFRLMFASGVVKLTSGCPTWWGLTAMNWHYESQCIPTPLAWFSHQTPPCIHQLEVIGTYLTEIFFPFLFFAPLAAVRAMGVYAQVFLMTMIMLTGNYNFFNLITCGLVISSLDDDYLPSASTLVKYISPVSNGGLGAVAALLKLPFKLLKSLVRLPYNVVVGAATCPVRAVSTVGVMSVLAASGYLMRVLGGVGVDGNCGKLTFNRPELEWFLAHFVPLAVVMGVLSLLGNVVRAYFHILSSQNKSKLMKLGEVIQTSVVSCAVMTMFAVSLVPITELDRETQNKIPLSVQELYHRSVFYYLIL